MGIPSPNQRRFPPATPIIDCIAPIESEHEPPELDRKAYMRVRSFFETAVGDFCHDTISCSHHPTRGINPCVISHSTFASSPDATGNYELAWDIASATVINHQIFDDPKK
jgi:hypothetical protein